METAEDHKVAHEAPADNTFVAPSIDRNPILSGASYTHFSSVPEQILQDPSGPIVLGVDEAGRGPVLGPMVYACFYLPSALHDSLLAGTHHFDDSKALSPSVRSDLMRKLCTAGTDLYETCGWAISALSARDISSNMLSLTSVYNLNAQAMDATIFLIQSVFDRGVNVKEIYIDTIGSPQVYQQKLQKIFPTAAITVAKKADSLYPCVSAASVCAKVTRDAALELCRESYNDGEGENWGSGYPSDARCVGWLKRRMDPMFGWGPECRFSWGTAKDLLEGPKAVFGVDWPLPGDDDDSFKITDYGADDRVESNELRDWYGSRKFDGLI